VATKDGNGGGMTVSLKRLSGGRGGVVFRPIGVFSMRAGNHAGEGPARHGAGAKR
jgi:hypothetical protein